jgi:hypothetical protein
MVMRIVVVRRDHDGDSCLLGGLEQANQIWNKSLLRDALADDRPGRAFGAHEVDLGVDDDQRGTPQVEAHARIG